MPQCSQLGFQLDSQEIDELKSGAAREGEERKRKGKGESRFPYIYMTNKLGRKEKGG